MLSGFGAAVCFSFFFPSSKRRTEFRLMRANFILMHRFVQMFCLYINRTLSLVTVTIMMLISNKTIIIRTLATIVVTVIDFKYFHRLWKERVNKRFNHSDIFIATGSFLESASCGTKRNCSLFFQVELIVQLLRAFFCMKSRLFDSFTSFPPTLQIHMQQGRL